MYFYLNSFNFTLTLFSVYCLALDISVAQVEGYGTSLDVCGKVRDMSSVTLENLLSIIIDSMLIVSFHRLSRTS